MSHIGYIRRSHIDLNNSPQLVGVKLNKVFVEIAPIKDAIRPVRQQCINSIQEGDILHVQSICRICRSSKDLLWIVNCIMEKKAKLQFHHENILFDCNGDTLPMLSIVTAMASFEAELRSERRYEGLIIAKNAGKHLGRNPILSDDKIMEIKILLDGGVKKGEIAKKFGVSRATIYNVLKRIGDQ